MIVMIYSMQNKILHNAKYKGTKLLLKLLSFIYICCCIEKQERYGKVLEHAFMSIGVTVSQQIHCGGVM